MSSNLNDVNVIELNLFLSNSANSSNLIETDAILPVQSSNCILALFATLAVDNESALLNSASGAENVNVSACIPSHIIFTVPEKSVPVTYTV